MSLLLLFKSEGGGGETITSDKWDRPQQQPLRAVRNVAAFAASLFFVPVVAAPAENVTLDKWQPRLVEQHAERRSLSHLAPAYLSDCAQPTPRLDSWEQRGGQPYFDVQRRAHLALTFSTDASALTQPERATPDKWEPRQFTPRFDAQRRQWSYPSFVTDPAALTQPERASLDKWEPRQILPKFDVPRRQWAYPSFFIDALALTQPERTTPDKWLPNQRPNPSRALARPWLEPAAVIDPHALTRLEAVSIDRWQQPQSRPRFDVRRQQHTFPILFADAQLFQNPAVEVVTLDKWFAAPQPVPRGSFTPAHLFPALAIDPSGLTAAERAQLDKWAPRLSLPVRVVNWRLRPHLFAPDRQPEPRLDSWHRLAPEVPRAVGDRQRPAFFAPDRQPEPPIDGWARPTNDPPRVAPTHRERPAHFAPDRQPVPPYAWAVSLPEPGRLVSRVHLTVRGVEPVRVDVAAVIVTMDMWEPRTFMFPLGPKRAAEFPVRYPMPPFVPLTGGGLGGSIASNRRVADRAARRNDATETTDRSTADRASRRSYSDPATNRSRGTKSTAKDRNN